MISIYGVNKSEIDRILSNANILDKAVVLGECLDYQIDYNDDVLLNIFTEYNDNIYSKCGKSLAETFAELTINNGIKFSVAESLTGGSVASSIVKVPGISSVMMEGIVCYSYESKHYRLNVSNEMLDTFGAVSSEVCKAMLLGQNNYDVRLCMSTTGIAGPAGESHEDTVGLTFIGTKFDDDIIVNKYIFDGNREEVIKSATNVCIGNAIVLLKKHLLVD